VSGVKLPLALPVSDAVRASRTAFQERLRRYRKIRNQLQPEQCAYYDAVIAQQMAHDYPPALIAWGRYFFPHYFTLPSSRLHLRLAEILQWKHHERCTYDAIVAPRSGAKTTWTSKLYTLFCICHDLEHYILLIGDSSEQSYQNLAAVKKELEENEVLAAAYPQACGTGRRWNQSYIVTKNDIKVEALGTRKKVRGRTHGPHRPGLIIIDDLENDEGVQSPAQRDKVFKWLNRALLPCGSEHCNVLFVGTALHPEDALQKIRNIPGWRFQTFAALSRPPIRQDLWDDWRVLYRNLAVDSLQRKLSARAFYDAHRIEMDRGVELLWPEKEPLYDLMEWRENKGELAFEAEKQGNAAAAGVTEFRSDLFTGSIWFDTWPYLTATALALDPSKGQNERNDYSAFVWGGLAEDGNIYIDADLERRDVMKIVEAGIEIYRKIQPDVFGIESVMFQQLFSTIFLNAAQLRNLVLPIVEMHPREQKLIRIRKLTPYLSTGRIKFRAGSRGAELLVEQLKWFPTCQHDDGPDALQMVFELLSKLTAGSPEGGLEEVIVT
jgi:predicted phage terminase large subunit-like protein